MNILARLATWWTGDKYLKLALEDQRYADYPGCRLGFMDCHSTICMCRENTPCSAFVFNRARLLREDATQTYVRIKRSVNE